MTSYYREIDGQKYDAKALDVADQAEEDKLTKATSIRILRALLDGGRYTETERRTLAYILSHYHATPAATRTLKAGVAAFGRLKGPPTGELPDAAVDLHRRVYEAEMARGATEERAARLAWGAVRRAGWRKRGGGAWTKS